MTKVNAKNERTKRAFFRYLKNADGCCDSTVNGIEAGILEWQEFSNDEDFALYTADKAIEFKKWLVKRGSREKPLALVTYHAYLRHLRKFFTWLIREPGYKSRIKPNAVDYLKPRKKRSAWQSNLNREATRLWNMSRSSSRRSLSATKSIGATGP